MWRGVCRPFRYQVLARRLQWYYSSCAIAPVSQLNAFTVDNDFVVASEEINQSVHATMRPMTQQQKNSVWK